MEAIDIDIEEKQLSVKLKGKRIVTRILNRTFGEDKVRAKFYRKTSKLKISLIKD